MKMFPEEVSKFSPCFSCKEFFAQCTGYAINDISGDAHKSIPDVDGLFKSWDLVRVSNKRTSLASCKGAFQGCTLNVRPSFAWWACTFSKECLHAKGYHDLEILIHLFTDNRDTLRWGPYLKFPVTIVGEMRCLDKNTIDWGRMLALHKSNKL